MLCVKFSPQYMYVCISLLEELAVLLGEFAAGVLVQIPEILTRQGTRARQNNEVGRSQRPD